MGSILFREKIRPSLGDPELNNPNMELRIDTAIRNPDTVTYRLEHDGRILYLHISPSQFHNLPLEEQQKLIDAGIKPPEESQQLENQEVLEKIILTHPVVIEIFEKISNEISMLSPEKKNHQENHHIFLLLTDYDPVSGAVNSYVRTTENPDDMFTPIPVISMNLNHLSASERGKLAFLFKKYLAIYSGDVTSPCHVS